MSLFIFSPLLETRGQVSASRVFIIVKSPDPTPTMMMLKGLSEASTIASCVSLKSDISPSVTMSRIVYVFEWTNELIYCAETFMIVGAKLQGDENSMASRALR